VTLQPGSEVTDDFAPYHHLVPRQIDQNVQWRRRLIERSIGNTEVQRELWIMCARDPIFYINSFCYIFEPRGRKGRKRLPWVTYEFQDETIRSILTNIEDSGSGEPGNYDIVIEKSRDMGASWMCLTCLEWLWHFHEMQMFLMLSRKESLVDSPDPKSLFYKLDFLHKWQPKWLLPRINRTKLNKTNIDNGSIISGDSTNKFAGVADRKMAILVDEFSLMENQNAIFTGTRDVTRCRIFNFTPRGSSNMAHEVAHDPKFKKLTLHWSRHPIKRRGLYSVNRDNEVTLIDTDYWTEQRQKEYAFVRERPRNAKFAYRSPWYDNECQRTTNRMQIAQELDIDYHGSTYQYFEPDMVERLMRANCQDPWQEGTIEFEPHSCEPIDFHPMPRGPVKLWCAGPQVDREYVVGVDIAQGTGASNSCICVIDKLSGEQVAEFVDANTRPERLADITYALCKWFLGKHGTGAFLIWEANGPGRNFGDRILELGYRNIYYRAQEEYAAHRASQFPGWWNGPKTNFALYSEYRTALGEGRLIIRSTHQMAECREYIFEPSTQSVNHVKAVDNEDPSGARHNHGDRPTAGALCWRGVKGYSRVTPDPVPGANPEDPPPGSLAWRRRLAEEAKRRESYWGSG
jgi:hypothetical protein